MHGNSNEERPRDARCSWVFWLISGALLILALIMATGAATLGVISWRVRTGYFEAQQSIAAEIARIRTAGEPLTAEELHRFHRIPDGIADTTPAWMQTLASFDGHQLEADFSSLPAFGGDWLAPLPDPSDQSKVDAVRTFLEKYEPAISASQEAANLPGVCRIPIEFEAGFKDKREASAELHSLIRLQGLKVRMHRSIGEIEEAIEILSSMIATTDALKTQPSGLDYGRRLLALTYILQHVHWLVMEVQLTEDQLRRIQAELEGVQPDGGLTVALIGDRGMMFQEFLSSQSPGVVQLTEGDNTGSLPGLAQDCDMYLRMMAQLIAASRMTFPQSFNRAKLIEAELTNVSAGWSEFERGSRTMTLQDIPVSVKAFWATANSIAKLDTMRAAIAAERYRLKTGSFPAELDDLVPGYLERIPIDPFDGRAIRLKVQAEEIVIYSVGEDLIDDNGQESRDAATKDVAARIGAGKLSGTP